jgi:ubiquinone/menaquinone biosynthesis C-methylase UbiE
MCAMTDERAYVYDEEVAARYDAAVPVAQAEVDFYLELARAAGARGERSLELTCGTGRVAIPLARAGIRLVGLDISAPMLAEARRRSDGLTNVDWVEGDMRAFDLGEKFGLIYIPVGSFQLLLTIEDQLAALRCIRRHLAPDGLFAFEVENPQATAIAEWLTTKRGLVLRNPSRDYTHPTTGRQVRSSGWIEYHPSEQIYTSYGITEELDPSTGSGQAGDGIVLQRSYGQPMTLRYFYRYELEHMLARAGLEIEALYGDVQKNEYRATSPDFIIVAKVVDNG